MWLPPLPEEAADIDAGVDEPDAEYQDFYADEYHQGSGDLPVSRGRELIIGSLIMLSIVELILCQSIPALCLNTIF